MVAKENSLKFAIMNKHLNWAFLNLLIVVFLFSCNNVSFDKKRFNKLIGRSPTTSYVIDVSEGKTEIEKTLILKYNNMVEVIISGSEKNKKGEKLHRKRNLNIYNYKMTFSFSYKRTNTI